jgi:pimeloyl-ACP methyl ester carboxylesterase
MDVVSIPHGDDHRPALLHRAGDAGAADLVVNLHGAPGSPLSPSSPLVDALLPESVDVLRFNYSGLWGNPGRFSASAALDDVAAVLDFVASDAARERYGLAPARTHLVGYAFGAAIALVAARGDDRVHGAVALAPCDHGRFGRQLADPDAPRHAYLQSMLEEVFGEDRPVDQDPAIFRDDLIRHADRLAFDADPGRWTQTRLLLLGALDDATCPIEEHLLPLYRELRRRGHLKLEAEVFTCGHSFADVRLEVYARIAQWVVEGRPKAKRSRG